MRNGIRLIMDTTENESLVHRARNLSVARFYNTTAAEYFMFIDADIHFDPESVLRLMKSGYDVAVAAYPKKCIMWDQAATEDGLKDPALHAASLVMNLKAATTPVTDDGFVEVLDGPTGFMLIKRAVFAKMFEAYPELNCRNDHQNRDHAADDGYCAVFDCMIDPETRRYLSEDYAFCRRWQHIGGKIHADCCTTLGHVGNVRFGGILEERLKALAAE
jgi:hypothetical protein